MRELLAELGDYVSACSVASVGKSLLVHEGETTRKVGDPQI